MVIRTTIQRTVERRERGLGLHSSASAVVTAKASGVASARALAKQSVSSAGGRAAGEATPRRDSR
jgi:hypothetical protein